MTGRVVVDNRSKALPVGLYCPNIKAIYVLRRRLACLFNVVTQAGIILICRTRVVYVYSHTVGVLRS